MLTRLRPFTMLALAAVILCVGSLALAQDAASSAAAAPPDWERGLALGASAVVAFTLFTKTLAAVLGFFGSWYPALIPAAKKLATWSTEVHDWGVKAGDALPGGTLRMASRRIGPPALVLLFAIAIGGPTQGCSLFTPGSAVQQDTEACAKCAGSDVIANYTSGAPVPFYPQLTSKIKTDCAAACGADLTAIINAVATSGDPQVQATPAFGEAKARREKMLAGADAR